MSAASAAWQSAGAPFATAPGEACPLCGAPLHQQQDWCLSCGAAARTRLAATPNWKGLMATLAVVIALALGVLAAALVKLAAGSATAVASTRTVTTIAPGLASAQATAAANILPGADALARTVRRAGTSTSPGLASSSRTAGSRAAGLGPAGLRTAGSAAAGLPAAGAAGTLGKRHHLGARAEERLRKLGLLPQTSHK